MDYDPYDALLIHIHHQLESLSLNPAVSLRTLPFHFRLFPQSDDTFLIPVSLLNPAVAVKIRSPAVHAALNIPSSTPLNSIHLDQNTRIQVLPSISALPRADNDQSAAFIRDERVLVVWSDDVDNIIPLVKDIHQKIINLVWRSRPTFPRSSSLLKHHLHHLPSSSPSPSSPSATASYVNLSDKDIEKENALSPDHDQKSQNANNASSPKSSFFSYLSSRTNPTPGEQHPQEFDPEKALQTIRPSPRPIKLLAPFYAGLAAALSIFFVGSGINVLIAECVLDGTYYRLALLVTVPFLFCISLFFALQVVSNIAFLIGPVAQYHENSKYYSVVRPQPNPDVDANLPHVTIQLPVYKESLEHVIAPSVFSLKKAMQTYARQGGTSSIFVCDDGLRAMGEAEREKRMAFYADHRIGWVARPLNGEIGDGHEESERGFVRAGRFKKASNMNYGLRLSMKMEKHLRVLEAAGGAGAVRMAGEDGDNDEPGDEDTAVGGNGDESMEEEALRMAVEEMYEESGRRWRPWASNGKSIRVGEIILLVDSDTVVPDDCFRDAARELAECPDVAIIQHESDVMQVAHHYFENGIAHFTRRINNSISMGCANGDVAPFVGHNAFLRWSALQDAAIIDPADGEGRSEEGKIWSENNVSEDFDMALRLQMRGYVVRWANYSEGRFKEGVSLTVDDELNRWRKYAYGCNELIFNPVLEWFKKGPITKQLRTFLWSDAPVHYKLTMMSYMFSYYGLAAAALLSVVNYIVLGFALEPDGFYMHSLEIWLACTVVFPAAGNLGFTVMEYRLGKRELVTGFVENMMWVPFFFFFFGGLSLHLSSALLAHLLSIDIGWGATKKEVERSNFFKEVPRILRRYWGTFGICGAVVLGVGVLSTSWVPAQWRVLGTSWAVIVPLVIVAGCHILFPIVLNPWLMIFSY